MSHGRDRAMPAGIVYPISPVMERSDLAGTWMCTPTRTLPVGIVYLISPVMARSDLAGDRMCTDLADVAGRHRQSIICISPK